MGNLFVGVFGLVFAAVILIYRRMADLLAMVGLGRRSRQSQTRAGLRAT